MLPWLGELAEHARARGIVPNLTTSGLEGLDALVAIADRFGQINVSLDGLRRDLRARARLRRLRARRRRDPRAARGEARGRDQRRRHARTTSTSSTRSSRTPRERRLSEVELLRFKPSGRGARAYAELRCTDAQHRAFLPTILAAARRHARARQGRLLVHADARASPPGSRAARRARGVRLHRRRLPRRRQGRRPAHRVQLRAPPPPADGAARSTRARDATGRARTRSARSARWRDAAEPCASCSYHALCRGGCKVVSAHVLGDLAARRIPSARA